ncbi:MAG TPA: LemA family protein [Geobacteraceae bacterium]
MCIAALTLCIAFFGGGLTELAGKRDAVDRSWQSVAAVYQQRAAVVPQYMQKVSALVTVAELPRVQAVASALTAVHQLQVDPRGSEEAWQQYQDAQEALTGALAMLDVVQHNNPRLKADERASELAEQLESLEDRINSARRSYNVASHEFNLSKRSLAVAAVNAVVLHLPPCLPLGTCNSSRVAVAAS